MVNCDLLIHYHLNIIVLLMVRLIFLDVNTDTSYYSLGCHEHLLYPWAKVENILDSGMSYLHSF